jgi:uncharacterized protein (TIGR02145 family)
MFNAPKSGYIFDFLNGYPSMLHIMSRLNIFIILMFFPLVVSAQSISITFTGKGAAANIDSITAINLRTSQKVTLPGNETLVLTRTTGALPVSGFLNEGIVYPNPFSNKATFIALVDRSQMVYLKVQNFAGQVVAQSKALAEPGENVFALTVANSGIYLVSLTTDQGTASYKVVCLDAISLVNSIVYMGASPGQSVLKSSQTGYNLEYVPGDIIQYKCKSGIYTTILTNSPTISTSLEVEFSVCTDLGGKNYTSVIIGDQIWMGQNLAYLPSVSPSSAISGIEKKYYVNGYEGTSTITAGATANFSDYGVLYNWPAATDGTTGSSLVPSGVQGVCPSGWHLPSDGEWKKLEVSLGMTQVDADIIFYRISGLVGKKLKSGSGWDQGGNGDNSSGFAAVPGGDSYSTGFTAPGISSNFWTATSYDVAYSWYRELDSRYSDGLYLYDGITRYYSSKSKGFSVRCVKDQAAVVVLPTVTTTQITEKFINTAKGGGNVTSNGGGTITARGVCWGVSSLPTVAGNHTSDGTGTGVFISSITGLLPNTQYTVRAYATNSAGTAYGAQVTFTTTSGFLCGTDITVNHTAGAVAPVAKTVTYGTVNNIPGEPSKCWITSNLGADRQATSVDDATEASAGWYWQFNRKQGYKNDGNTRTPSVAWNGSIDENTDWVAVNDPCVSELGAGWRIPTYTEWTNVIAGGSWVNWNGPWNSALKIHAAGTLFFYDGSLEYRGSKGFYTARSQDIEGRKGGMLSFESWSVAANYDYKGSGLSIRCIKDFANAAIPRDSTYEITNITQTSASCGGKVFSDGGALVTARGVCWGTAANPIITNPHTTDGSETGVFTSKIAGLSANTTYYVRAYATNGSGTGYGNEVTFTTLAPSVSCGTLSVTHLVSGGIAPVNKQVSYSTITNVRGEIPKCWITSNLGASHEAAAVDDATEESAGWYWQFNRKSGFSHDGVTRTPNTNWISVISENFDWQSANDPCTIELGAAWRIPTKTEWENIDAASGWTDWLSVWNSGLKLHAAGVLGIADGASYYRGTAGSYWSSKQNGAGTGYGFTFSNGNSEVTSTGTKAGGLPLRCVKDVTGVSTPNIITNPLTEKTINSVRSGGTVISDGGGAVSARGVCWNTSSSPTIAGNHTNDGIGIGPFESNIAGLQPNTQYFIRAYATNMAGTAYGEQFTFITPVVYSCGTTINILHTAGLVSPFTKVVAYGTVTNIPGEASKCWITSNLGADRQSISVSDGTESSAGWYWQFNRKQGYQHDGTLRTPNTSWIPSYSENSDWLMENDPCASELGNGWRLPTETEWTNVDTGGSWTDWNGAWNSDLKLHGAGFLSFANGALVNRGSFGNYWSSKRFNAEIGQNLSLGSGGSNIDHGNKANGFSVRCIHD